MMSNKVDKRNRLEEEVFSYQSTKDKKVFIFWHDKQVKTLTGLEAEHFLHKMDEVDDYEAQLLMANLTGNFKRGNERKRVEE